MIIVRAGFRRILDTFLLDSRDSRSRRGGTGKAFDWEQAGAHGADRLRQSEGVIVAGGLDSGECQRGDRDLASRGEWMSFRASRHAGEEGSGEGAGVCEGGAGDGSEDELENGDESKNNQSQNPQPSRARWRSRGVTQASLAISARKVRCARDQGNEPGRFGVYGGRYVPETLMAALDELEREYEKAKRDPKFQARLEELLRTYAGRPTPLYFARRLTEKLGGAKIYLKREDLLHTGAHKINNCLGQALLVERMGKRRVIAETGAGQHGVATATVCALLGFECVVYMGTEDMRRQELNVFRMRLLGAEVRGVESGSRTLKDAINEAMRDWVTNVRTTHYLLGSVLGAHPYPTMVRDFHRVIGREARAQILKAEGKAAGGSDCVRGRRIECDRDFLRFYQG